MAAEYKPEEFTSQQQWEVVNNYRDIKSDTPEELWDNAISYFQWCKDNPIEAYKTALSGKDFGKKAKIQMPVMYTIKGMCLHCNILEEYFKSLRGMKDSAPAWYQVASKILYLIHDQNMTYAALDLFNPILAARLNNIDMEDKETGNIIIEHVGSTLPVLSTSESQVLEKLESEKRLFPGDENQKS